MGFFLLLLEERDNFLIDWKLHMKDWSENEENKKTETNFKQ